MKSFTVKSYWKSYKDLSNDIQKQADIKKSIFELASLRVALLIMKNIFDQKGQQYCRFKSRTPKRYLQTALSFSPNNNKPILTP